MSILDEWFTDIEIITEESIENSNQDLEHDSLGEKINIMEKSLPKHIKLKCKSLGTKETDSNNVCSFRIYAYSKEPVSFYETIRIGYNDGVANQNVIVNLTGNISAPGDIYTTQKTILH